MDENKAHAMTYFERSKVFRPLESDGFVANSFSRGWKDSVCWRRGWVALSFDSEDIAINNQSDRLATEPPLESQFSNAVDLSKDRQDDRRSDSATEGVRASRIACAMPTRGIIMTVENQMWAVHGP